MKMRFLPAIVLLSIISIVSCMHQSVDVTPTTPVITPVDSQDKGDEIDTALCFERDILPIFITNCARSGCHDAASRQEGYEFTSYATITSKKFTAGDPDETELFEKITEHDADKIMPPPPFSPLTNAQVNLVRRWIIIGAPNTTGCKSGCDSAKYSFAADIQPILNQNCRGCHSSAAPSGGIALDSHVGVSAVASNGRLLGAIRHEGGFTAMPQGGAKLSACKIKQVEKWVANGALND
jgi:hypothetical protein